jgi:hypothetical protein
VAAPRNRKHILVPGPPTAEAYKPHGRKIDIPKPAPPTSRPKHGKALEARAQGGRRRGQQATRRRWHRGPRRGARALRAVREPARRAAAGDVARGRAAGHRGRRGQPLEDRGARAAPHRARDGLRARRQGEALPQALRELLEDDAEGGARAPLRGHARPGRDAAARHAAWTVDRHLRGLSRRERDDLVGGLAPSPGRQRARAADGVRGCKEIDVARAAAHVRRPHRHAGARTPAQLAASIDVLNDVAEVRKAKETATVFVDMGPEDQGDGPRSCALASRRQRPRRQRSACSTPGVTRGHPLLEASLDADDCHSCDPAWGTHDHDGHGTEMAGLALYGDLTPVLAAGMPVALGTGSSR